MARFWLGLAVATTVGLGFASGGAAATSAQRPNIIVIQTDDQDAASVTPRVMPSVIRLLAQEGTTFTDYIDSGPLCCPSRAVMLTGQYGHNNGVLWNAPNPYGDLRGKDNTLPVWLQRAGYTTVHLGKYLNEYARGVGDPNEIPPGWDEWHTALEAAGSSAPLPYYDYTLRENGHAVDYGSRKTDYITRQLDAKAVNQIHRYAPGPKPLFIALDEVAPHKAANRGDPRCHGAPEPSPKDQDLFADEPLPMSPSFNEADVSDKPSFIRAQPRLSAEDTARLRRLNGCRLASLRAVDRGVSHIFQALREEGELDNTAVFFTSDNGYLLGQHREEAKVNPYEESLHVPLIVRLPPAWRGPEGAPRWLPTTVANVDIAPTILQLAGAEPCPAEGACRVLDGRSLLDAIRSHGQDWPQHRGIPLELKGPRAPQNMPCDYQGVRTRAEVFVEYRGVGKETDGRRSCEPIDEVEHYDLRTDPFELDNIFPAPPGSAGAARERFLSERVRRLSDCAGIAGRDPEPASGHYCE